MTHAIAWIVGDAAYMTANALVTHFGARSADEETLFGEPIAPTQAACSESAVKVIRLSENAVATLSANDAIAGIEALKDLSTRMRAGMRVEDALVDVQRLHPSGDFSLLVVAPSRSGSMSIFKLADDQLSETYEDGAVVISGSAGPGLRGLSKQTVTAWSQHDDLRSAPDLMLANVLVAMQAQGPRQPQIERGIGGTMFGLCATRDSVRRHDDILYVLAEPRSDGAIVIKRFIHSGWRGDVAFTRGFHARNGQLHELQPKLLMTSVNPITEDQARETFVALRNTLHAPRFVAWVDVRSSAVLMFEQNPFTERLLGGFRFEGPEDIAYATAHASEHVLATFPALADVQRRGIVPFWFIASPADVAQLIATGRWGPCSECRAAITAAGGL